MATQTTGGGSTTSLDNTVQAKDDYFAAMEDQVLCFDVMANDLGGSAKTLWSIDNTSDDGSGDLIAKDLVGVVEFSELGAKISLTADGKIKYDTTLLDSLGAGETVTDQFTYCIRLSNGTLSWATVNVTLTGSNDAPEISVLTGDSAAACFNEGDAPLSTSGTLTVNDVDTSDVVDTTVSGISVSGNQGTLSDDDLKAMLTLVGGDDLAANVGDSHNLTWNFGSTPEAFDFLAEGQSLVLTYTLTSSDGHGGSDTQTVTITIKGTNDGPVANADDGGSVGENETKSFDVIGNDTDVDDGAVLSLASIDGVTVDGVAASLAEAGALSMDGDEVKFTPGTAFDHLAAGDSVEVVVSYTVEDEHGASSSSTLTFTVTGSNDAAMVTGDDAKDITEDAVPNTVSGDLNSTDVDGTDDAWDADTIAGDYGSLAINADGTWTYTLDNSNPTVDALNDASPALTDTITVKTEDGTEHDVVITINGHTDASDVLAPTDIKFSLASTVGGLTGSNLAANATLGSFTAVDGDSSSWTFGLSGANASLFTLSPTSGGSVNLLTGGAAIATGQYSIDVTATDSGGNHYTETFTVSVGSVAADGTVAFTISAGSDVSFGINGGDTINGGAGEDALVGGNGSDTLNGGLGNDQLFGGQQDDIFILNTAISPAANVDSIMDFDAAGTPNSDQIHLDDGIFVGIANSGGSLSATDFVANVGGDATSATQNILYDTATGNLYYDADGNGGGAKVLIAHITVTGGTVDASDFLVI
jgi:VCBS repeat-containing protein